MTRTRPALAVLLVLFAVLGCGKKKTTVTPTPTATVTGVVQFPDGSADVGALVDAQSLAPVNGGALEIVTVQTVAGGAFTFSALTPGKHTISVIENDSLAVADTVDAPSTGDVVRLKPGVVLRGIAFRPDTTTKTGVIVSIDLPTAFGLTDSTGFYEIRGVAPGARVVYAYDALTDRTTSRAIQAVAGDTVVVDTIRITPPAALRLATTARVPTATRPVRR